MYQVQISFLEKDVFDVRWMTSKSVLRLTEDRVWILTGYAYVKTLFLIKSHLDGEVRKPRTANKFFFMICDKTSFFFGFFQKWTFKDYLLSFQMVQEQKIKSWFFIEKIPQCRICNWPQSNKLRKQTPKKKAKSKFLQKT